MHVDNNGLPIQADGCDLDQLQRCSMIVAAYALGSGFGSFKEIALEDRCRLALSSSLQPRKGVYTRNVGGDPRNVSADQLLSALAAWVAIGTPEARKQASKLVWRMLLRGGFAQNVVDGLDGGKNTRRKIPDFMLLRALPLVWRTNFFFMMVSVILLGTNLWLLANSWWWALGLLFTTDLYLILLALGSAMPVWKDGGGFKKRSPNDVDDNVTVMTLAVCHDRLPSVMSRFASYLYGKLRPWNFGCFGTARHSEEYGELKNADMYHPVYGALRWYHREESGGNPEIAEFWEPICKRLWG